MRSGLLFGVLNAWRPNKSCSCERHRKSTFMRSMVRPIPKPCRSFKVNWQSDTNGFSTQPSGCSSEVRVAKEGEADGNEDAHTEPTSAEAARTPGWFVWHFKDDCRDERGTHLDLFKTDIAIT